MLGGSSRPPIVLDTLFLKTIQVHSMLMKLCRLVPWLALLVQSCMLTQYLYICQNMHKNWHIIIMCTHTHTHTHTHNHQAKLEEAVEILSEMVNRQYLRTPQSQMGEAARNVDCLCNEYLSEMKEVANIAYCALIAEQRRKQMVDEPPPKPPRANPAFPHSTERPQANTRVPENDLLRNLENFVMFVDPDTGRLHIYMGEGITIPVDVLFNRQGEEEDV